METKNHPIILFDGVCNLCNRSVQFIIDRDKDKVFSFAPLQSEKAEEILEEYSIDQDLDTLILIKDDEMFTKSSAYVEILKELGTGWKIFSLFLGFFPVFLTDIGYDVVARFRYKVFGKRQKCMVPSEDVKNRFLDYNQK
jgi:predicted DCC family thiol-disulfide oxidoreductase YuxK